MAITKQVNGKSYEVLRFPMKHLRISQGAYGTHSHAGVPAIDIFGQDEKGIEQTFAPCKMKLVHAQDAAGGNAVFFESVDKVLFADGSVDYATMLFVHDDCIDDILSEARKGRIWRQWEPFGNEGNTGNSSGNHCHFEIARGRFTQPYVQNEYGIWQLPGSILPDRACIIDGCTVYNGGQPLTTGYPMSWKTSHHIPGIEMETAVSYTSGWKQENGGWYYYARGLMCTGWLSIQDKTYYLGQDGRMCTGWKKINGSWYYFCTRNNAGYLMTGWIHVDGKDYYLNEDGRLALGWKKIKGYWYYFSKKDEKGYMMTGWNHIDGHDYYFESSGHMALGWKQIKGEWYYFCTRDEKGYMMTGWIHVGGHDYYLYDNGKMAKNTWIGSSYVDGSGKYVPGKKK